MTPEAVFWSPQAHVNIHIYPHTKKWKEEREEGRERGRKEGSSVWIPAWKSTEGEGGLAVYRASPRSGFSSGEGERVRSQQL